VPDRHLFPDSEPDAPAGTATAVVAGTAVGIDDGLVDDVAALVEGRQRGMVLNLITDLRAADLADLLTRLPEEAAQQVVRWMPGEETSEAVAELESGDRADLLDGLTDRELITLLDHLDTDDAADVLADMDEARADSVLTQLEDADDVEALLRYGEDTAGGLMGTEYVAVPEAATIAEATEAVRACADTVDPIYVVYVVGADDRLVGAVPLKQLLLSQAEAAVADVTERDLVTVGPDLDQEEVARLMERYDLVSLPVVSASGKLLGRITIDDVVDVIREEAEEDLQRAVGITGDEELSSSVFAVSRGRLPWLAIGMAGAFVSGLVIQGFEGALEQAIVLATFIPLVTATGGNAAIQSAAIAVQGLTSGDLWLGDGLKRLGKEVLVALLNGVALGLGIGLVVVALGLGDPVQLALTVGLTLLTVVIIATTVGALVPFGLQRAGIDPASAMGPFVTTLNDIVGLSVYFAIASVVYL
jgi:magnesium transporter